MDKYELYDIANEYDKKSREAMLKYQETGNKRYYNSYAKDEDIAEGLRAAASARDDHEYVGTLRMNICTWATKIREGEDISEDLVRFAEDHGLIQKDTSKEAKHG